MLDPALLDRPAAFLLIVLELLQPRAQIAQPLFVLGQLHLVGRRLPTDALAAVRPSCKHFVARRRRSRLPESASSVSSSSRFCCERCQRLRWPPDAAAAAACQLLLDLDCRWASNCVSRSWADCTRNRCSAALPDAC